MAYLHKCGKAYDAVLKVIEGLCLSKNIPEDIEEGIWTWSLWVWGGKLLGLSAKAKLPLQSALQICHSFNSKKKQNKNTTKTTEMKEDRRKILNQVNGDETLSTKIHIYFFKKPNKYNNNVNRLREIFLFY